MTHRVCKPAEPHLSWLAEANTVQDQRNHNDRRHQQHSISAQALHVSKRFWLSKSACVFAATQVLKHHGVSLPAYEVSWCFLCQLCPCKRLAP